MTEFMRRSDLKFMNVEWRETSVTRLTKGHFVDYVIRIDGVVFDSWSPEFEKAILWNKLND